MIPVSAMHASLYRCGSQLSFENFCKMDHDFINKLGKDSYGRQWHRFSKDEQLQKAFEAVNDKEQQNDGIAVSNFGTFLKVLDICIGDEEEQKRILLRQVETHASRLVYMNEETNLGESFGQSYEMSVYLGGNHSHMCENFWQAFSKTTATCFHKFFYDKEKRKPEDLALLSNSLFSYVHQVQRFGLNHEIPKIIATSKQLVVEYVKAVCAGLEFMTHDTPQEKFLHKIVILDAILTVALLEPTFSLQFGELKIALELCRDRYKVDMKFHNPGQLSRDILSQSDWLAWFTKVCTACGSKGHSVLLTEVQSDDRNYLQCERCPTSYSIPENDPWSERTPHYAGFDVKVGSQFFQSSIEDPNHFGHFVWVCCKLIRQAKDGPTYDGSRT